MQPTTSSITLAARIINLIAPRRCVVCGRRLAVTERVLCTVCNNSLPRTGYAADASENDIAELFYHLLPIERAAAWFFYQPHSPVSRIIYSLKYRGRRYIGSEIGAIMAQEFVSHDFFLGIDLIVPVPLAKRRRRERGYNQSTEIARGISYVTGLPIVDKAVRRRLSAVNNASLSGRRQRMENVEGVFSVVDTAALEGRHILIVDDIVTTGSTILSLCQEIKSHVTGVTFSVLAIGFTKA